MSTNNSTNTAKPIKVASGGTGNSTLTAYAPLCGGTTTTGNVQSVASVGTSGQVLTSNGAGALPTFQTSGGGGYTPKAYTHALWVSPYVGSDSALGTSIETPFATIQKAVTTAGTTPTVIWVVDYDATYTAGFTTLGTGQNIIIKAPGLTFSFNSQTINNNDVVIYDGCFSQYVTSNAGLSGLANTTYTSGGTQPSYSGNVPLGVAMGPIALLDTYSVISAAQSNINGAFAIYGINITATSAQLASGGKVYVIPGSVVGQSSYLVLNVLLCGAASGGTNFSGGSGNRGIVLREGGGLQYASWTSTLVQNDMNTNAAWGSTNCPFGSSLLSTPTSAGLGLWLAYSGGTTDYTAGQINLLVMVAQIW